MPPILRGQVREFRNRGVRWPRGGTGSGPAAPLWDNIVNDLTIGASTVKTPLASLEPLNAARSRWPAWASGGLMAILLVVMVRELLDGGLSALGASMPTDPAFYLVFLAIYAIQPLSDFIIFRRLWGLPPAAIVAVLRKMVANEVLLGYSGEAYFYAWVRARLKMVAAPFAAIKDVSILSAVVGNVVTLALLALAAPFAFTFLPPHLVKPIVGSITIMLILSLAVLGFRRQIFSLPARDLWWIFAVHLARTIVYTLLLGLCWHLALPNVQLGLWILLVTGRQLVARLPLVPNKDIVFAGLALLLVGNDPSVARLVGITVALTLVSHILVFALTAVLGRERMPA